MRAVVAATTALAVLASTVLMSAAPAGAHAILDTAAVGGTTAVTAPTTPQPPAVPDPAAQEVASSGLQDALDDYRDEQSRSRSAGSRTITVEIVHAAGSAAVDAIAAAGGQRISEVTDTLIQADVPYDSLVTLDASPDITYLREPVTMNLPEQSVHLPALSAHLPALSALPAHVQGSYGGEIVAKTKADAWHAQGLTGAGVKIGVIDYFDKTQFDQAFALGEVPQPAGTGCWNNLTACTMWSTGSAAPSHGVAVAEVLHDMAPDAQLFLASVTTTGDAKAAID
jgi:hypothetical protein